MSRKITLRLIITALLLLGFSVCLFAKDSVSIIDGNKAVMAKLAPRFTITTLDEETFSLDELRGKKPVVISFWATWCAPCKKELPYLQKFWEKYKDNCAVIGISIDSQKQRKILQNKVKELKLTFPIALDYAKKLDKIYPKRGIPYLVVIDRDGRILKLQMGVTNPEKLVEELEEILGDNLKPLKENLKDTTKETPKDTSKD
jgi:cytochrome c biogenesis protein CcmG/thiol:disulfide interchange protein DsbE